MLVLAAFLIHAWRVSRDARQRPEMTHRLFELVQEQNLTLADFDARSLNLSYVINRTTVSVS